MLINIFVKFYPSILGHNQFGLFILKIEEIWHILCKFYQQILLSQRHLFYTVKETEKTSGSPVSNINARLWRSVKAT